MPWKIFSNREGVNMDSLCSALSRVVNYRTMLALALALFCAPSLLRPSDPETPTSLHRVVAALRIPTYVAAALTAAYALSGRLTRRAANNGVEDGTYDFAREIVLVTGGSGGLGSAFARAFRRRNRRTRIVLVDVAEPRGDPDLRPEDDEFLHFYRCDVTDADAVADMADRVRREVGHPTVLLNNAGVARAGPVFLGDEGSARDDGGYRDQELVLRTNLVAQILVTRQFLPEMVRRDHGHIVWSSSLSSVFAIPMAASYSATKAAVCALHDALQIELVSLYNAPRVRQTLGIFGFVSTPMVSRPVGGDFVVPVLHADTVGEAVAEAVYSTYGGTIYLPRSARYVAALRVGPAWLFRLLHGISVSAYIASKRPELQPLIERKLARRSS